MLAADSATTRFIVRTRNAEPASLAGTALACVGLLALEPAHFILQRGMMLGVKARAERGYHAAVVVDRAADRGLSKSMNE